MNKLLITRQDVNNKFIYIDQNGDLRRRTRNNTLQKSKSDYNILKHRHRASSAQPSQTSLKYNQLGPEQRAEFQNYFTNFSEKQNPKNPEKRSKDRKDKREFRNSIKNHLLKINALFDHPDQFPLECEIQQCLLHHEKKNSEKLLFEGIDERNRTMKEIKKYSENFEKIDRFVNYISQRGNKFLLKPSKYTLAEARLDHRREKITKIKKKIEDAKNLKAKKVKNLKQQFVVKKYNSDGVVLEGHNYKDSRRNMMNHYKLKNKRKDKLEYFTAKEMEEYLEKQRRKFRYMYTPSMFYKVKNDHQFREIIQKRMTFNNMFIKEPKDWRTKKSDHKCLKIKYPNRD